MSCELSQKAANASAMHHGVAGREGRWRKGGKEAVIEQAEKEESFHFCVKGLRKVFVF